MMRSIIIFIIFISILFITSTDAYQENQADAPVKYPDVVKPGAAQQGSLPIITAPADAIVLFDGTDLSKWKHPDGKAVEWIVNEQDSSLTIKPGSGSIISTVEFGDVQLHIEFATPAEVKGDGQGRGNSGVYLQAKYEVQVLDSYENITYPDGQCGAIYGQYVPLVNACRPPGEWQSYDIIFHAPIFDDQGNKTHKGTMTVLHNGILIQDNVELLGDTTASAAQEQPGDGPLYLQDHGCPVKYRNIWFRKL